MKSKSRILFGMLAFFASAYVLMPSASSMFPARSTDDSASRAAKYIKPFANEFKLFRTDSVRHYVFADDSASAAATTEEASSSAAEESQNYWRTINELAMPLPDDERERAFCDALFFAVKMNKSVAVKDFLEHNNGGCSYRNNNGDTPLLIAAGAQHLDCIIELLKFNETDIDAFNNDGKTMWHILLERWDWNIVRTLLGKETTSNPGVDCALVEKCTASFQRFMNYIDGFDLINTTTNRWLREFRKNIPLELCNTTTEKSKQVIHMVKSGARRRGALPSEF